MISAQTNKFPPEKLYTVKMDWDDQDGPPDLVRAGVELDSEEKPVKVPLTIVTGLYSTRSRFPEVSSGLTGETCRVPWGGQDDAVELHSYCRTWKEDRRHHEW